MQNLSQVNRAQFTFARRKWQSYVTWLQANTEVYLLSGLMLPARGRAGVGSLLCQVDIGRIITDLAGSCVEYSQRKLFLTNELLSHR